jgi:pyruvate dehydrogenase E2 component (dihydrolipoamide acetyltransferase)
MVEFKMPQLGETVLEAVVTRWLKKEGEAVEVDDSLVEVSTDKVDSEVPSPAAGTLSKILVQEGETVLVGATLAEIAEGGSGDGSASSASTQSSEDAASSKSEPAGEAASSEAPPTDAPPSEAPPSEAPPSEAPPPEVDGARQADTETPSRPPGPQIMPSAAEPMRGVLSPLVRRLAAEHQVDLATIQGSGTGGRITKQDVMAAAASRRKPAPAQVVEFPTPPSPAVTPGQSELQEATGAGPGEEIVQVSPMRRAIAEHMLNSNTETARAWNTIEVDMSRVAHLRELAGPAFKEQEGFSLTWMPFVCKAVTQALLKFSLVNSTWNGDGTITKKRYVNLGIAVALENGLIVPVVKGAEAMNIMGLARAVRDVAGRARSKKLTPDDVQGGTFTITNPGTFGSVISVPIINRGQAAILSLDAIVKRPVVVTDELGNDSIGIRHMTFISLSWDHRIMDGAEAAKFLAYLKELLEEADFTSDLGGHLPA